MIDSKANIETEEKKRAEQNFNPGKNFICKTSFGFISRYFYKLV